MGHLRVRDEPLPRRLAERRVAGPLALAGGAVEHARPGHRFAVRPADRHPPRDAIPDRAVAPGVHETLRRLVEVAERLVHVVAAARAVQREDGVRRPRRRQAGPRDAEFGAELVAARPRAQHRAVGGLLHRHLLVGRVRHLDGVRFDVERAPAVAVAVLGPVGARLVLVEVDHVAAGVGEPPRAAVVLPDDDERDAREGDPPNPVVGVAQHLLVPHRRGHQRQVRVVRHHRVAAVGVVAGDGPGVRPDPRRRLVAGEPAVQRRVGRQRRARGAVAPVRRRPGGRPRGDGPVVGRVGVAEDRRVVVEAVRQERRRRLRTQFRAEGLLAERSETPGERPRDLFLGEHHVGRRPRRGLVVEQFELDREREVVAGTVHALAVRLHERRRLRVGDEVPRRVGRAGEVHADVEAVGVERRSPDDRREFAAHLAALQVHLEQPVGAVCVPHRETQRGLVVALDPGHARVVVPEGRRAVLAGHPYRRVVGRGVPRPARQRRERGEVATDRPEGAAGERPAADRREQRPSREIA